MDLIKKYFYQIVEGCHTNCDIKFCRSNASFPEVPKDVALVLAHSIAGRVGKQYVCPRLPQKIPDIPELSTTLLLPDTTAVKLDQILSSCLNTSLFELGLNTQAPPMRMPSVLGKIKKNPSDHLLKSHFSEGLLEKINQAKNQADVNPTSIRIPSPDSDNNDSVQFSSEYSSQNSYYSYKSDRSLTQDLSSSDYSLSTGSSASYHSHPQLSTNGHSLENLSSQVHTNSDPYPRRRSLSSGTNAQVMSFRNLESVEEFIRKFTTDKPVKFDSIILQKMVDTLSKTMVVNNEPNVFKRLYARKQSAKRSSSYDDVPQQEEKLPSRKFSKSKIDPEGLQERTLLSKTVHYMFGDPLIMLHSFRKSPNSDAFNYEELLRCYHILTDMVGQPMIQQTLADSISFLLSQLKTRSYVRHPLSWMICYIASIYPEIRIETNLTYKLFKAYSNLGFDQKQLLMKNIMKHPSHLIKVIDACHYFIFKNYSISLENKGDISDDDKYSNSSNESIGKSAEQKALTFVHDLYVLCKYKEGMDLEIFYNDSLSNIVDFKREFKLYKRGKSAIMKHLYLFNCIAKTSILQIQSLSIMSKEYEDACVNHAMVVHTSKILQESITTHELDKLLAKVSNPYCLLEIRREYILEDVVNYKSYIEKNCKKPLRVRFTDGEEGLDQGGVQKEFFLTFVSEIMDVDRGLFYYEERERMAWIRHDSQDFELFEVFGMIIGLASYNGIILDLHFPTTLFKKLAGENLNFADFCATFPEIGRGLFELKQFEGNVENTFCLNFDITYDSYGEKDIYELTDDGSTISVNNENKEEYVELLINHKLNVNIKKQFDYFSFGFWSTCGQILKDFRGVELEKILSGAVALDFDQLEKWTKYEGYSSESSYIKYSTLI
eukprot:NODE_273_length_11040_cov_1.244036.p1 type:complete len:886 gc:universal NODE_273_length_11040_cov_1.244036:4883-2226(-)